MKSNWLIGICGAAVLAVACSQTDTGITTSVKSKLASDNQVQASHINVDTNNGVVTLTGQVRSGQEESRAVQLARETKGVKSVTNRLSVEREAAATTGRAEDGTQSTVGEKTREATEKGREGLSKTGEVINDAWITTKVKSGFLGEDLLKDSDISVDTNNHVVTLTGTVKSAAGRTRAAQIAKGVDGVHDVVDHLKIGTAAAASSSKTRKP